MRQAFRSVGPRQLVALARALRVGSRVLIPDEATANVDSETGLKLSAALDRLMAGRTRFVIARTTAARRCPRSTVRHADRILVLEQGRIVEWGAHPDFQLAEPTYWLPTPWTRIRIP